MGRLSHLRQITGRQELKFSVEIWLTGSANKKLTQSTRQTKSRSTKSEARNSKQIQMFKKTENFKQPQSGVGVLDFLQFWVCLADVCFGFRASDFGFCLTGVLARATLSKWFC
jgi:hypothetical protein